MDDLYSLKDDSYGFSQNIPSLDQILDKISSNGIDSLSDIELQLLKKYSNK